LEKQFSLVLDIPDPAVLPAGLTSVSQKLAVKVKYFFE
jgi:hypothetical protein